LTIARESDATIFRYIGIIINVPPRTTARDLAPSTGSNYAAHSPSQ
jgi:hypothetical protein